MKTKKKKRNRKAQKLFCIIIINILLIISVIFITREIFVKNENIDTAKTEESLVNEEQKTAEENTVEIEKKSETEEAEFIVNEIVDQLTLEEKVAQMFFVTPESITGVEKVIQAGQATKEVLNQYPVGGIVYFASNLISPDQTKEMLSNVQNYSYERLNLPMFLGIDEEGGRVLRIGNNPVFNVQKVESMGSLVKDQDQQVIYEAGNTIGKYLAELGFNVDFAPDADVLSNEDNAVIGDRSFGTDPNIVAEMAWAYSEGLNNNGVLATYKHFPGHGGTIEDSHSEYAYSYKTLDELKEMELIPFQSGSQNGVDFIMISHISTPEVTGGDIPASLSKLWVTDILRKEMGYEGIIITDSLAMGAVSNNYTSSEAAIKAVEAGCDMLLMPSNFKVAYQAVIESVKNGQISQERIDESVKRIVTAKQKMKNDLF